MPHFSYFMCQNQGARNKRTQERFILRADPVKRYIRRPRVPKARPEKNWTILTRVFEVSSHSRP